MTNRLQNEHSPYLLQHAENPVDWYPWGAEALDKARRQDKPIFLSIGFASCHWCHVMAHETFENPEIAAILNTNFISINVDREERPDLDGVYLSAVVALSGQGGWPLNIFLTPEGKPFFGGTYYPPVPTPGTPSFKDVLETVMHMWLGDRERINKSSNKLLDHLGEQSHWISTSRPIQNFTLDNALDALESAYDWFHGGWGAAPKFPQPMVVEFLLRQATRGSNRAVNMVNHTLEAMTRGGVYDVIGGGFHRYSTDARWLIPHFEKMLSDNAQLALVYLHAYQVTGKAAWRRVCEATLDFIQREMTDPKGGFYSSLDADVDSKEGVYYLWSINEIAHNLDNPEDVDFFTAAYTLSVRGNFNGRNVLQRTLSDSELASQFGIAENEINDRLEKIQRRLLQVRLTRQRPDADDKVIVSWNALTLQAFAEAARILKRPDYLNVAQHNARFILAALHPNDRLLHTWRAGQAYINAFLDDYANLILALLALYQSDSNLLWYRAAVRLCGEMVANYQDPDGGFFDTRADQTDLIARPKENQDIATPSGNASAAMALLQLAAYNPQEEYTHTAMQMVTRIQESAAQYATSFAAWLNCLDFAIGPVNQIALLYSSGDPRLQPLLDVIWGVYRPRSIAAITTYPPGTGAPHLFTSRGLIKDAPTAYVCENFTCRWPTSSAEELKRQLTDPHFT